MIFKINLKTLLYIEIFTTFHAHISNKNLLIGKPYRNAIWFCAGIDGRFRRFFEVLYVWMFYFALVYLILSFMYLCFHLYFSFTVYISLYRNTCIVTY